MTPFWDKRVAVWVAERIPGCTPDFGRFQALGVEHQEQIVAGLVFHDWNPGAQTIEISGAADDPRWFCRKVINTALHYAFNVLGCQMVVARQRLDNNRARQCWAALGASEAVVPRMYGRTADGTLMTLTDDAWRVSKFNKENGHGRQEQRT